MSSANISAGPASCMKFNSSFLYYVGFFILLVVGYMWGKRNGTKEERTRDAKKSVVKKDVPAEDSEEEKPIKGAAIAAGATAKTAAKTAAKTVGKSAGKAASKVSSGVKSLAKKIKEN
jgi:hypothetical protein